MWWDKYIENTNLPVVIGWRDPLESFRTLRAHPQNNYGWEDHLAAFDVAETLLTVDRYHRFNVSVSPDQREDEIWRMLDHIGIDAYPPLVNTWAIKWPIYNSVKSTP
jgi:hypothetical protein